MSIQSPAKYATLCYKKNLVLIFLMKLKLFIVKSLKTVLLASIMIRGTERNCDVWTTNGKIESAVYDNCRLTLDELSAMSPPISTSLLHKTMPGTFKYRKLFARWIPKLDRTTQVEPSAVLQRVFGDEEGGQKSRWEIYRGRYEKIDPSSHH